MNIVAAITEYENWKALADPEREDLDEVRLAIAREIWPHNFELFGAWKVRLAYELLVKHCPQNRSGKCVYNKGWFDKRLSEEVQKRS
jgi:hypothetical protein